MDTRYPIRKADGKDYDSLDTLLNVLRNEPDGWWLASSNRQWHGGIHISRRSAPESVLTSANADRAVPFQCIANGEVAAWRINKNYCTAPYDKYQLRYSSTFLLVRSEHQPNPDDQSTWLTFYTLYMHLAPVSAYPTLTNCYRVKPNINNLSTSEYNGREISGQKLPKAGNITLKENDLLVVSKQETFKIGHETTNGVFGLAQLLKDGSVSEKKFWVSLEDRFVEPVTPRYHRMPEWMTKAVEHGEYDAVVIPEEKLTINAGDAIGFLAEDNSPAKSGSGGVDIDFYSHIEVISVDTNMPGFLSNPKQIKTGRAFVKIKAGKPLYQKSGEGDETTFSPTNTVTKSTDDGRILPRDKASPIDAQGTTWFQIAPDNWVKGQDVDVLSQHDLSELGFITLEESSTDDFGSLLKENFLKGIFDWVSKSLRGDTEFEGQQGSETYKKLVKVIDQNNDGNLSQYELAAFEKRIFENLHSGENNVPNLVRRLIVKHDSEWFGDSKHKHWQSFLNNDSYPEMMPYLKKWRDDMAWMSEVPEFKSGKPVWHFHPVEFLDILSDSKELIRVSEFVDEYIKMHKSFAPGTPNLSSQSRKNLEKMLKSINSFYSQNKEYKPNLYRLAYMLATARHETYHFTTGEYFSEKPEVGDRDYFNKYDPFLAATERERNIAIANENTEKGDGYKYRGRGCVHLTWRVNYRKAGEKYGINLVHNPDLAGDFKYSVPIMVWGMEEGIFTGKEISSYINAMGVDYEGARKTINGSDQKSLISSYATKFQSILEKTSSAPKGF
ncbi:glycoside hydrolase family 19 protein [Dickeya fangzhongdai]|uniref:glycoside hydrolase family 19 protein n=1 Tax=Dickeya fangzhongdai TaxID=1778540 RepID=UPI000675C08C|nr:glycoside hydrolase family 19 protein [Dickeya fangzhongdai]